jgi:hypothetical protein
VFHFVEPEKILDGRPFGTRTDDASLAQNAEMVGERGFGHVDAESAAGDLTLTRKLTNDGETHWIAKRLQKACKISFRRLLLLFKRATHSVSILVELRKSAKEDLTGCTGSIIFEL